MGLQTDTAENRRKYTRNRSQELTIHFNDKTYTTHDWTPGGFSIKNIKENHAIGDQLSGMIEISNHMDSEQFSAEVTRVEDDSLLAVKFVELSAQGYISMCDLTSSGT